MENLQIASRYAHALYDEAKLTGEVNDIYNELIDIRKLLGESSELRELTKSMALSSVEKYRVMDVLGKSFHKLVHGLLLVLAKNGRLSLISAVIDNLEHLVHEANNETVVYVEYAKPISDNTRKTLNESLVKLVGRTVITVESIKPSLIGGMRIKFDSRLYDFSIKGRLDLIKNSLLK